MRRFLVVASKLLVIFVLCCSTGTACSSRTSERRGVITGRLEMVGGPAPGRVIWVRGSVTATPVHGGSSSLAHADSSGRFRLLLPTGTYELTGSSPQYGGGAGICRGTGAATVRAGFTTSADVLCQMM